MDTKKRKTGNETREWKNRLKEISVKVQNYIETERNSK